MYFSIPNLRAETVREMAAPWEYEVPADVLALTPEEFKRSFSVSPSTEHAFVSFAKGRNPAYRVTKDNEIAELHGFFGDYDGVFSEDMIGRMMDCPPSKFLPTWWIRTVSGGLRLAWEFESPVRVSGNEHAADLLRHFCAVSKAVKWGSDFDQKSKTGFQYMDIGRGWHRFSAARVSRDLLESWAVELAVKRAKVYSESKVDIPFDKVRELVREKFGDAVPSRFEPGVRCRRFWDASSDNDTGCVVTEAGVYVFVPHDKPFMGWDDILGRDTVEEFTAKQVSPMLRRCFYCPSGHGGVYWRLRDDGHFVPAPKTTFVEDLKNLTDISDDKPKGGNKSPMDEFCFKVREEKAVDCAAPILFEQPGAIRVDSMDILNISRAVAMAPADPFPDTLSPEEREANPDVPREFLDEPDLCLWDNPFVVRRFPHIHRYLTTMFMSEKQYAVWERAGFPLHDIEDDSPERRPVQVARDRQLTLLLSWLSCFYRQAVFRRKLTQPGQALILAGGVGLGKTFFAEKIVGELVGGSGNARDYFIDGSSFTDDITDKPVLLLDDVTCDTDSRTRAKFTMRVKTCVATAKLRHHAKFQTPVNVSYRGRLVILCNDDPSSLSVLPNLDSSTADKIIMLKLGGVRYRFGTFEQNSVWLAEELPQFARFLMGYTVPEQMKDDRFGVKAWQHESMRQAVSEFGIAHTVTEILAKVFEEMSATDEQGMDGSFVGTVTDLMSVIKGAGAVGSEYAREIGSVAKLRYALRQMAKANPVIHSKTRNRMEIWTVPYSFAGQGQEMV